MGMDIDGLITDTSILTTQITQTTQAIISEEYILNHMVGTEHFLAKFFFLNLTDNFRCQF